MNIIFHLSTCSTNQRILKESNAAAKSVALQDIKTNPVTPEQLDAMKKLAGTYEALFSRKAMKFRSLGLHEKQLTEKDYRNLLLQEYTFLKRPVALLGNQIFIGNSKANIEALKRAMDKI